MTFYHLPMWRVIGAMSLVSAAACPGYELGNMDVEDDTSDAKMTDAGPTSVRWDITQHVSCGVQADGSYLGPCMLELEPRRYSTLCDEWSNECVAPEASCREGWCRIPARSYLSGAGPDGPTSWTHDAAILVVSHAFELHQTETTLAEFLEAMGYVPEGTSNCGSDCPVAGVSVFEAMEFANRKSEQAGLERCYELLDCGFEDFTTPQTGLVYRGWRCDMSRFAGLSCEGYRLPSAGEWELAARAGSPYCLELGPLDAWIECDAPEPWISEIGTYCENAHVDYRPCVVDHAIADDINDPCYGPLPVRAKRPNAFGLYGVHGNVSEWIQFVGPVVSQMDPHRWEPPYEVLRDDVPLDIVREDVVYTRGGAYLWRGGQMCSWGFQQFAFDANAIRLQLTGFRLARTLLESD